MSRLQWERPFPARWMSQFFVTPADQAHVSGTLHGLFIPHRQCPDPTVWSLV